MFVSLINFRVLSRLCKHCSIVAFVFGISGFSVFQLQAQVKTTGENDIEMGRKYPKRVYQIKRIEGDSPTIDGVLDEACWQLGKWDGGYLQREPHEGAEPTDPTEIKLVYDNDAIYVAIRAFVKDVANRDQQIGRRDSFAGDMVGIAFDSYFDRRTAVEFDVSGGGSKVDILIHADGFDKSWNAVWDVAVGEEADAWVSEFKIPFSQLRFPGNVDERVWGLHSWRWHRESNMESNWQIIPRDNSGFVYQFGELRGLEDLKSKRQFEIMPYFSGSLINRSKEDGNPFRDGLEHDFNAGLDAKIGITSNFIADLTINPDFGQVEADPSELNLSKVETFFKEQRPFFLEGKSLFEFEVNGDLLFYSRRIGRHPSHTPDTDGFVDVPHGTRILSAGKLTGKTENGLSVGSLFAVAAKEDAIVYENGNYRTETAEPQTQYFVTRARQEFEEGGTAIGGIVSVTLRDLESDDPTLLTEKAMTGGVDLSHRFLERTHFISASVMGSHVAGSAAAIEELQRNYLHNYIRPDADHIDFDPTLESLTGYGGVVGVGKDNGGNWRYGVELDWRTPGLEINDVGFIDVIDRIRQESVVRYVDNEPGDWFKSYQIRFNQRNHFVSDGTFVKHEFDIRGNFKTNSNWSFNSRLGYDSEVLDTRGLRGGPAVLKPGSWNAHFDMSSDGSKDLIWWVSAYVDRSMEGNSSYKGVWPGFQIKKGSRFRFNFNVGYSEANYNLQWMGVEEYEDGRDSSYFLGRMKRDTFQSTIRLDYNFTPEMSLTYYGNLYLTSGTYEDYKLITHPRADRLEDRYYQFAEAEWSRIGDSQLELRNQDGIYSVDDPDFNYRSFRSNLVFRWEYKPGSTVYIVWSQDRENTDLERFSGIDHDFDRLVDTPANNTILIKASYWFSI